MKLLLLVIKNQTVILDSLYEAVAENANCDIHWLSSSQQSNFKRHIDITKYDRIILFVRFKKESQQISSVLAAQQVAERAQQLAVQRYSFSAITMQIIQAIEPSLAEPLKISSWKAIFVVVAQGLFQLDLIFILVIQFI